MESEEKDAEARPENVTVGRTRLGMRRAIDYPDEERGQHIWRVCGWLGTMSVPIRVETTEVSDNDAMMNHKELSHHGNEVTEVKRYYGLN